MIKIKEISIKPDLNTSPIKYKNVHVDWKNNTLLIYGLEEGKIEWSMPFPNPFSFNIMTIQ